MAGIDDFDYIPETTIPGLILSGGPLGEALRGTGADELLDGAGGNDDPIHGFGGNDVIIVGPGSDKNFGGSGIDTALFAGDIDGYSGLNFSGADVHLVTDIDPSDGDSGFDRLKAFEFFEFRDAIMNARTGEVTFKATGGEGGLMVTTLDDVVADNGEVSLREAIATANGQAGEDTITFSAAIDGGTILLDAALGQLAVTDDLIIDGDTADGGADGIVIAGAGAGEAGAVERILRVDGANLGIEDATIQDGGRLAAGDGVSTAQGGGIAVYGGDLVIERGVVAGNFASLQGGGIYLDEASSATIANSVLQANSASNSGGESGEGGAIFGATGSTIAISDSRLFGNDAGGRGGAIDGDRVTITRSSIEDNTSFYGPASVDADNLTLRESLISNNQAVNSPIGLAARTGSIVNSTIVGNSSLVFDQGTIEIQQSTLFDNGGYAYGGVGGSGTVRVENSILLDSIQASIVSNGANIFGAGPVAGATGGDLVDVSRDMLFVNDGALALNGGTTRNAALLDSADNPALDGAVPADATATDQRGQPRDGTPDIGAFELQNDETGGVADIALLLGVTETGNFGNRFAGQSDADGIITASFTNTGGDAELSVRGFDIDYATEVRVLLNGNELGFLSIGPNEQFNGGDVFAIAAAQQQAGTNILTFEQDVARYVWGISDIRIDEADAPPPGGDGDISDLFPAAMLTGTDNGEDLRQGGDLDQVLNALGGDDVQHGLGGNDFLIIGPGSDKNYGGSGFDVAVFDGVIGDFSGVSGVRDAYTIDDLNSADGDLGFDRVKAVEIFAFDDALFDTRTGQTETFNDSGALVARLEDLIATGDSIV